MNGPSVYQSSALTKPSRKLVGGRCPGRLIGSLCFALAFFCVEGPSFVLVCFFSFVLFSPETEAFKEPEASRLRLGMSLGRTTARSGDFSVFPLVCFFWGD